MFSSNIGFRRRTHSDGSNQLYQRPLSESLKRTSVASHRHSLDDSSSTAIKRIVLRKHSGESTGTRGLADRIARSEVENIGGFWSRRLSGQKRSVPSSPKHTEFQVNMGEWKKETAEKGIIDSYSPASKAEKGKGKLKGPRPLPLVPTRTSMANLIPSLTSNFPETPSSSSSSHEVLAKITAASTTMAPPVRNRSPALPETPGQLSPTAPLSLKKIKTIESGIHPEG